MIGEYVPRTDMSITIGCNFTDLHVQLTRHETYIGEYNKPSEYTSTAVANRYDQGISENGKKEKL